MPRSRPAYPPEFRQKLIELVHAGHSPQGLVKEFEPTAQTICNWVERADANGGRRQLGHWEGDTLRGSSRSTHHLLALVERTSCYLVLRRPRHRPV